MSIKMYLKQLKDDTSLLPVELGGTGADNPIDAAKNLGLLTKDMLDVPYGVAVRSEDGKVKIENIPDSLRYRAVNIEGPIEGHVNQTYTYKITDYDMFTTYTVSAVNGTASISNDIITFTAGDVADYAELVVNNIGFNILIKPLGVVRPTIITPVQNFKQNNAYYHVVGSKYTSLLSNDTHAYSIVEVSTYKDFSVIEATYTNQGTSLPANTVAVETRSINTEYYFRLKYVGTRTESSWSPITRIVTKNYFAPHYEARVMESNPTAVNNRYGSSVAVNGTGTVAVICNASIGTTKFAMDIYYKEVGLLTWTLHQRVTIDAPAHITGDYLGWFKEALVINHEGNMIYLGSPYSYGEKGSVIVVTRDDEDVWKHTNTIRPPETIDESRFGLSLAINANGNFLAVGSTPINSYGRVYTYAYTGSAWVYQDTILPVDISVNDGFGSSIAIDADANVMIIGAPNRYNNIGRAVLYKRNNADWTQIEEIGGTEATANGHFGYSVDINNDATRLVVGSPYKSSRGSVLIYDLKDDKYTFVKEFNYASIDATVYNLGSKVQVSGDGYVVTSSTVIEDIENPNSGLNVVPIWCYSKTVVEDIHITETWELTSTLTGSSETETDYFGKSIALSTWGNVLLSSAPYSMSSDGVNETSGVVYVFS